MASCISLKQPLLHEAIRSTSSMIIAARAGNIARALTLCQQMMQSDPDNTQLAKAFKRAKALDAGKESGNSAFKHGDFQTAYDACASQGLP